MKLIVSKIDEQRNNVTRYSINSKNGLTVDRYVQHVNESVSEFDVEKEVENILSHDDPMALSLMVTKSADWLNYTHIIREQIAIADLTFEIITPFSSDTKLVVSTPRGILRIFKIGDLTGKLYMDFFHGTMYMEGGRFNTTDTIEEELIEQYAYTRATTTEHITDWSAWESSKVSFTNDDGDEVVIVPYPTWYKQSIDENGNYTYSEVGYTKEIVDDKEIITGILPGVEVDPEATYCVRNTIGAIYKSNGNTVYDYDNPIVYKDLADSANLDEEYSVGFGMNVLNPTNAPMELKFTLVGNLNDASAALFQCKFVPVPIT